MNKNHHENRHRNQGISESHQRLPHCVSEEDRLGAEAGWQVGGAGYDVADAA